MITLRMGSHDPHVRFLQRLLNHFLITDRGLPALNEDSIFGQKTDAALRRFQARYTGPGGRLVQDGVAGSATWRALKVNMEISHPLPRIGQNTGMTCWVVAGGLASGRMTSAIPGQAEFDPATDLGGGGLGPSRANLALYAQSLGMRLLGDVPRNLDALAPHMYRGPIILVGDWVGGGKHAVVGSGIFSAGDPYLQMIRINNSLPQGVGSIELSTYPLMELQGTGFDPYAVIVR